MTMITFATTIEQATAARGEVRAGGTDVQERRRTGVAHGDLVDISMLQDESLRTIRWNADGSASIGVLVSIDDIANDAAIQRSYPGLALAAGELATPQIRVVGTLGGNLLQRTRCWYYRHPAFTCFKGGGEGCPMREGHHEHGVCFDLGPCVYPHPSTLGMTLLTYDATVTVNGNDVRTIAALYGDGSDPTRDHLLSEGELLTHIHLPPPVADEQAAYFRAISRYAAEWPLVEASVRLVIDDQQVIRLARVAVGGVANIPLRLPHIETALEGKPATADVFASAAEIAKRGASPLPGTVYKLELLARTVLETLERAIRS